ncbi:MAG: ABC transporter ATP-binding protein [Acidobacteria bacterium]|nr:ABC transporter ATP-binding protein [Acidobacteriota bacterium]
MIEWAKVKPAVEMEDLTKVFSGRWRRREVRAVDGVTLRIERGTSFGLLGPNGAGKTTLGKMLLACTHPSRGRAWIFGRDAREPEARRRIGYLPENHRFPTYMTGRGMLDFYAALAGLEASARRRRIPELLELVGLERWGGMRLGKYSKGMLQRLGLAQALMNSPELLILDEPADGVDPIGRRQIRDILGSLEQRGVTVLLNSHLLSEVELFCRQVAILHRGRLALEGGVRELTAGTGYRLAAAEIPERIETELRALAAATEPRDGARHFLFPSREQANRAIDLLRGAGCAVEELARTRSTLEEVFVRTIDGA